MTRRVLLGTGAVVIVAGGALAAAEMTGRLDDLAGAVGIDPKPLPDPADVTTVRRAATGTAALLAAVQATAALHPALALAPFVAIGREHLDAVGGTTAATDVAAPSADPAEALEALEQLYDTAATDRAVDAGRAVSPDLARVLASMSAGLTQCNRQVRGLR